MNQFQRVELMFLLLLLSLGISLNFARYFQTHYILNYTLWAPSIGIMTGLWIYGLRLLYEISKKCEPWKNVLNHLYQMEQEI